MVSELRPNTFTQYRKVVENNICQYKPFVGVKLKKLTLALVQSYINDRVNGGLSPNSIRKYYCIIHKCDDPIEPVVRFCGQNQNCYEPPPSAVDGFYAGLSAGSESRTGAKPYVVWPVLYGFRVCML